MRKVGIATVLKSYHVWRLREGPLLTAQCETLRETLRHPDKALDWEAQLVHNWLREETESACMPTVHYPTIHTFGSY
jgi:hypothetical protein